MRDVTVGFLVNTLMTPCKYQHCVISSDNREEWLHIVQVHIPPACIANWSTRKLPALNVMATVAVASVFCIVPYMVVGTYTHLYSHCRQTNMFITPRAHARSGVKQSVFYPARACAKRG